MAISAYTKPVRSSYVPFDYRPLMEMQDRQYQTQMTIKNMELQDAATAEATLNASNQLLNSVKAWDAPDKAKLEGIRNNYLDPLKEKAREIQARGGSFTELLPFVKVAHQNIQNDLANGDLYKIQNRYTMGTQAMSDVQDYLKSNEMGTPYANYAMNNLDENGMRVMLPKSLNLVQELQKNFAAEDSEDKNLLLNNAVSQLMTDYGAHTKIQFEGNHTPGEIEALKKQTWVAGKDEQGNDIVVSAYDEAYQDFVMKTASEAVYGKKKIGAAESADEFARGNVTDLAGTRMQGSTGAYPVESSTFSSDWKVGINPKTGKKELQDDAGNWTDFTNWLQGRELNETQKKQLAEIDNAYSNYSKVAQSMGIQPTSREEYVYNMQQMGNFNYVVPTKKEEEELSKRYWDPETNSGLIRNVRIWDMESGKELLGDSRSEMLDANFNPAKKSENPSKRITVIGKLNEYNPYTPAGLVVGFGDKQWVIEIPGQNVSGTTDLRNRAYKASRDKGYFKDLYGVDDQGNPVKASGVWVPEQNIVRFTKVEYLSEDTKGAAKAKSASTNKTSEPEKVEAPASETGAGGYWNYGDYSKVTYDPSWTQAEEWKSYTEKNDRQVTKNEATQIKSLISKYSSEFEVNPAVVEAMLLKESGAKEGGTIAPDSWRVSVLNGNTKSRSGAQGIGQFMPATAKQYGVDPMDLESSIRGTANYVADLKNQFGTMPLAIAAYNCGPGRLKEVMAAAGYPYGAGPKGNPRSFTPEAFEAIYKKMGEKNMVPETKEYLKLILPYARSRTA